ncbi:HAD family hydrolase [Rhizobium azibense]|uniref:Putative HAD superfamily hydrolase n=1 Tax=Rhizobium azibense TaxID=1136135 RepID=A0A4R3RDR4_9HYPH|nr:HAD family hydrolase [Rhizobium azibense]TCU32289.1 putative HAD superfamily hydrolase [Rhizobium azibense]
MHVLIWSPPWPTQGGDLFFGLNAFKKALLRQAEALLSQKCKVTIAFPDAFSDHVAGFKGRCDLVSISSLEVIKLMGGWADPSVDLYVNGADSRFVPKLAETFRTRLPETVDCVLLWETPVPYLRAIYPEALIVSQMPGAFARAPYPHTIIFDTLGLYRDGTMFANAEHILSSNAPCSEVVSAFKATAREIFHQFPIPLADRIRSSGRKFTLLPLQISDHYAFKADTGFSSQAEFCLEALGQIDDSKAVVVTQYISNMYKDVVMTPEFTAFLAKKHSNLEFDAELGNIPSVSQHLIQDADEVAVATSGLGLQAMIWGAPLKVVGNTHLSPYDGCKVGSEKQRDNALSFALTKHQPMASKINDGRFLIGLLEELMSRRQRPFDERYPRFSDIDPHYDELLLSSFRQTEVERDFIKAGATIEIPSKEKQFSTVLKDQKPAVISFDLFDTLVIRGFEAPADLYRLLELEVIRRGLRPIFDFAGKRLAAELAARRHSPNEEITVDDIYSELAESEKLPFEEIRPYRDIELDVEVAACHVRPIGKRMFAQAKAKGIPVVVTSDMYLPRSCIDAILMRTGYEPDAIYLSSEVGLTKKSGSLFDHISRDRGISLTSMVHVGDNIRTDIEPAESRKITALHVPKSADHIARHPLLSAVFTRRPPMTSLGRSVTAAAIAHKLFDDSKVSSFESLSRGDPWLLGYVTVGPLLLGMASWVRSVAIEMKLEKLHFLSREGRIIKDAFDRICAEAPCETKSNYLYGSRRAIRVAQLETFADIAELASQTIARTASLGTLLSGRFGLDPATVATEHLTASGFSDMRTRLGRSAADHAKLLNLLKGLEPQILDIARCEAANYRGYLSESGLFSNEKFAVVDVGWNANMQGSLGQILGKPLIGLYLASLEGAGRWKNIGHTVRGYLAEDCAVAERHPILSNRLMLENMLCDITPSVERIRRNHDGSFEPIFSGDTSHVRRKLVHPIQQGARSFVDDVCRTLGSNISSVDFRPDIMTSLLADFLHAPKPVDAALFVGCELEDTFSGTAKRYFIAPKTGDAYASYWKRGEAALLSSKSDETSRDSHVAVNPHGPTMRRPMVQVVRPFIRLLGNSKDIKKFDKDPAGYFRTLKNPTYRAIGTIMFPLQQKSRG